MRHLALLSIVALIFVVVVVAWYWGCWAQRSAEIGRSCKNIPVNSEEPRMDHRVPIRSPGGIFEKAFPGERCGGSDCRDK